MATIKDQTAETPMPYRNSVRWDSQPLLELFRFTIASLRLAPPSMKRHGAKSEPGPDYRVRGNAAFSRTPHYIAGNQKNMSNDISFPGMKLVQDSEILVLISVN
jgi:hypothetical protein